jgi:hypothetical protein
MAVLLGLAMEGVLLLVAAGFGLFSGIGPAVADTVKQVSWSVLVCGGLALGTAVSKLRTQLMGLLGLVSGPVAFQVARALHQGTKEALEVAPTAAAATSLLVVAVLKGIEYGALGASVGWLSARPWGGLKAHLGAGLLVGVTFGGAIVAVSYATFPVPPGNLTSQTINEVLFPVGCAFVLFAATAIGERAAG